MEKETLRLICETGDPHDTKLLRPNGENLLEILPVTEIGFTIDTEGHTLHLIIDSLKMEIDVVLPRGAVNYRVTKNVASH